MDGQLLMCRVSRKEVDKEINQNAILQAILELSSKNQPSYGWFFY